MDARGANDRIAKKAEHLQFVSRVPMLCECDAVDCRTIVLISLADYYGIRSDPADLLIAHDHYSRGTELRKESSEYQVRHIDTGRC